VLFAPPEQRILLMRMLRSANTNWANRKVMLIHAYWRTILPARVGHQNTTDITHDGGSPCVSLTFSLPVSC
jgi:hypothetical protein